MRGLRMMVMAGLLLMPGLASAQEPAEANEDSNFFSEDVDLKIRAELKANFRWSQEDRFPLFTPFPPDFVPAGQENVALETVDPGSSLEVSKATVYFDVGMPRGISARIKIDFIDLYDRNPTSTDKVVDVDEAWIAFGERQQSLVPSDGTSFYALVGKAPKFERQAVRRIETYGLVSTAFNRFNDLQIQVGGSIGSNVYFFGQVSDGNPIFMRDPNALAGDNGTAPPPNPVLRAALGLPGLLPRRGRGPADRRQLRVRRRGGLPLGERGPGARHRHPGLLLPDHAARADAPQRHPLPGRPGAAPRRRHPTGPARGRRAHRVGREPRPARGRLGPLRPARQGGVGQPAPHRLRSGGRLPVRPRRPRRLELAVPGHRAHRPLQPTRQRLDRAP